MNNRFHSDFRYTALIGRSVPMPAVFGADYWEGLLKIPGFFLERTRPKPKTLEMERKDWRVDRLYCMSAFRPEMEDDVSLHLQQKKITLEEGLDLLPEEGWEGVSVITGRLTGVSLPEDDYIGVSVHSYGRRRIVLENAYLLSIHYVSEIKPNGDKITHFLRGVLDAFAMSEFVQLDNSVSPPQFVITQRSVGGFFLSGIHTIAGRDDMGIAARQIAFEMTSKTQLREAFARIASCFSSQEINWEKSRVEVNEGHWEGARPWFEARHKGPWDQKHYRVPYHNWNPELFLSEGARHEVIPVGVFDFSRAKKSGVGPPLKGHRIFVDLFREGENWHFAFHHAETIMLMKRREPMRHALNELLGTELISLSPETIWPSSAPSKKTKSSGK